jgi:hypothetical protein
VYRSLLGLSVLLAKLCLLRYAVLYNGGVHATELNHQAWDSHVKPFVLASCCTLCLRWCVPHVLQTRGPLACTLPLAVAVCV